MFSDMEVIVLPNHRSTQMQCLNIVVFHLPPSLVMLAVGSKMQAATSARSAYKLATSPISARARESTCRDPPGHRC